MLNLVLIAAGVLAAYALLCLVSPTQRCPKCGGARIVSKGKRRKPPCPRCKAHGVVIRPGAALIHQLLWANASDRLAGRRDRLTGRAAGRAPAGFTAVPDPEPDPDWEDPE